MGNIAQLKSLIENTTHVDADALRSAGASLPNSLPPFDTLPQQLQDFVTSLRGLEPYEQVSLIHQTARDMIIPEEQAANDVVQDFASILQAGKGDCDDFVIFERGLIDYANQQAGANITPRIVAGDLTYSWAGKDEQAQSQTIAHNYIIAGIGDDVAILDQNSQSPYGINSAGDTSILLDASNGQTIIADVAFNSVSAVYNADGSAEMAAEAFAPAISPQMPTMTPQAQPVMQPQ